MLFCVTWSKYDQMAMKCLTYLRKTVQTGPRHYSPHFVEFAAATVRSREYFMILIFQSYCILYCKIIKECWMRYLWRHSYSNLFPSNELSSNGPIIFFRSNATLYCTKCIFPIRRQRSVLIAEIILYIMSPLYPPYNSKQILLLMAKSYTRAD